MQLEIIRECKQHLCYNMKVRVYTDERTIEILYLSDLSHHVFKTLLQLKYVSITSNITL